MIQSVQILEIAESFEAFQNVLKNQNIHLKVTLYILFFIFIYVSTFFFLLRSAVALRSKHLYNTFGQHLRGIVLMMNVPGHVLTNTSIHAIVTLHKIVKTSVMKFWSNMCPKFELSYFFFCLRSVCYVYVIFVK